MKCWKWVYSCLRNKDEADKIAERVNFLAYRCEAVDDAGKEICVGQVNLLLNRVFYDDVLTAKQKDMMVKGLVNRFGFLSGEIIFGNMIL